MALDFPTSPVNGQGYQGSSGAVWIYDSTSGSWKSQLYVGSQGVQGAQGVQGTAGTNGVQGAQGVQGASGVPSGAVIVCKPESASFPTSNPAQFKTVAGTNFPVESLAFDAATEEICYFKFVAINYVSGNITVTVRWYADTASSGDVVWGASLAAITPNTDTQDIETKAFGTEATATDSHLGTTGQRLHSVDITVTSLDSIAGNDYAVVRLARKAASGSDTMAGDALAVEVLITYT